MPSVIGNQFLDHCWVCGVRFNTANPPGPATEERHHVIPVAAGGVDGPQFSLCSDHHNLLHRMAERLPDKPFHDLIGGENYANLPRLKWLAYQAYNALAEAESDPNKHVKLVLQLDPELRRMVEALKGVVGVGSRAKVARYAIRALYARHFTK